MFRSTSMGETAMKKPRAELIRCLAPNRRVEIERTFE